MSTSHVVIRCPSCSQKYRVTAAAVGHRARCTKCKLLFVVGSRTPCDEDTIVSWITEADPASESVMGSTGLFHPPDYRSTDAHEGHPVPTAAARAVLPSESMETDVPRIRLLRIEEDAAHFEFPVSVLADEALRDSFPRRCAGCGTRHGLSVHLLCWPDRMRGNDATRWKEHQNAVFGEWEQFANSPGSAWLARFTPPWTADPPFHEPFPFLVCKHCKAAREVQATVVARGRGEVCALFIRSLATAVEFYRNNGGRSTPDYQRLIEERNIRHDRMNELSPEVRTRLSHWFTPLPGERFVRYFPDAEFSPAEAGNAGAVLTVRRLVMKRFAAFRDYPLNQVCRLDMKSQGDQYTVHITEEGHRPAVLVFSKADANQLVAELKALHARWSVG